MSIPPFAPAPGATKALDNLTSVAINISLIPATNSTIDLGSTTIAWANLYVNTIKSITGNALALTPVSGQNLTVNLATTGDFIVNTNQLYIDTSANSVGIGTTSPAKQLHIQGGDLLILNGTTALDNSGANLMIHSLTNPYMTVIDQGDATLSLGATTGGIHIGTDSANIYFRTGITWNSFPNTGNIRFQIASNGNIFVGTAGIAGESSTGIVLNTDVNNLGPRFLRYQRSGGTRFDFGYDGGLDTFFISDGTLVRFGGDRNGSFHIRSNAASGHAVPDTAVTLEVETESASVSPLVLIAAPSQTADIMQWQNSANTVLGVIDKIGNVGIGTTTPNANALLDITSTTKAFMPPRMTTTQRDLIASPTAGMVIYNSTTNKLNVYTTIWEAVTSA